MAIDGGGGGGMLGFSNSFTGPAEAIEIIGDHAYAYNALQAVTTAAPILQFTTGNYYLVGKLILVSPIKFESGAIASGLIGAVEVKFNDGVIGYMKHENPNEDMGTTWMEIIIPAYTEVQINHLSDGASAGFITSVSLTGRIYR